MAYGNLKAEKLIYDDNGTDEEVAISTLAAATGKADLTGADFTGPINVGVDDTGHDVKFFGAAAGKYCLWDESQNTLFVNPYLTVEDQATFNGQINLSQTSGDQNIVGGPVVFGKTVGNIGFQPHLKLDYGVFEAYWQGAKKFETTTDGAKVTGDLEVTSNIHLGSANIIYFGDGANDDFNPGSYQMYENTDLYLKSNAGHMRHQAAAGQSVLIEGPTGSIAKFIEGGACELYHDDVKKLETTTSGVTVTGELTSTTAFQPFVAAATAVTAAVNTKYATDTSSAAFTLTLPASPTVGQYVTVVDIKGSWATNNLTVAQNGKNIQGAAADLICNVNHAHVSLIFSGDATTGWIVT